MKKWGLIIVKVLLTLAFASAGLAKLAGVEMMVATFDNIGWGQWFRYLTGVIEVGGAIGLWVRGYQGWAAAFLGATMVGAVTYHAIYGDPMTPAIVLGILSALVLRNHKDQVPVVRDIL